MTNTILLERRIEKSGLKKGFIADSIGLTTFGLAKKIRNESEFKASEINSLCEILHIESLEEKEQIFFAN